MTTNGNNLEPEFDAVLAAHVKSTAPRAVCAQFDPDTASAYLERALTKNALASYETHLADCASCRRQITALVRLMPAPALATTVASPESATRKQRWSEWFTGWRLGALAGFGAVAATALLLAVLVPRSSQESMIAMQAKDAAAAPQASPLPTASSATESSKSNVPTASAAPVATPATTMRGGAPENVATMPEAPQPAPIISAAPPPPPVPTPAPKAVAEERKESAQAGQAADMVASANQARNAQNLTPSGPAVGQNQPQTERQLERARREEPAAAPSAAASSAKPQEKTPEREQSLSDRQTARRDDSLAKKSADAEGPRKDDKAKAVVRPPLPVAPAARPARPVRSVSGKSFRLENGFWIDTEYDPNKGAAVIRLPANSDEFKQTLQDTPALKPYFDLAPVLVVWQGKVYRVEKK